MQKQATKPAVTAPVTAPVANAPAALSPRAAALAAHNEAGFTGRVYAGLSKTRNAGNPKAPNLHTSKATARTYAELTPRMQATLTELAARYAAKPFPLCGIDRGQAAIFLASGFFLRAGETNATLSPDTLKRYAAKPSAAPAKADKPAKA